MKSIYTYLTGCRQCLLAVVLLMAASTVKGQYVTIPDTNMVYALQSAGYSSCLSGNQLDTTCAALSSATYLNISGHNIHDIYGVQFFDNLVSLNCSNNPITSIWPALPSGLISLRCANDSISSMSVITPLPTGLDTLDCSYNQITAISSNDYPAGLVYLDCSHNNIAFFVSPPSTVTYINCSYNTLYGLPVLPVALIILDCSHNFLTGLPSFPSTLYSLNCSYNSLTSIPAFPTGIDNLTMGHNNYSTGLPTFPPSVKFISCIAAQLNSLPILPDSLKTLVVDTNMLSTLPNVPFNMSTLRISDNPITCLPELNYVYWFTFNNTSLNCFYSYGHITSSTPLVSTLPLCVVGNSNGCAFQCTPTSSTMNQTICQGNSFSFNGMNLTNTGIYYDTLVNAAGCDSIIILSLGVLPLPVPSFTATYRSCTQTDVCADAVYTGNASLIQTYAWTFGTGTGNTSLQNPVVCFSGSGVHLLSLSVTDIFNCQSATPFIDSVDLATDCVWPGDADNDGVTDNFDVFPIGLGYSYTGPVRPNASLVYIDQPAPAWSQTLPNAVNMKHADINGDGVVDAIDTTAILQNFSQIHPKPGNPTQQAGANAILWLSSTPTTAANGTQVTTNINLGTTGVPADSIYGVAFTFVFDPLVVDTNTVSFSAPLSWLYTSVSDHLEIHKTYRSAGLIKVGTVRIDHTPKSGFGPLGLVNMDITTDDIVGKPAAWFTYMLQNSLTDVRIIGINGQQIPVTVYGDSVSIQYEKNVGIKNIATTNVQLYPNPANNIFSVKASVGIEQIQVINTLGAVVYQEKYSSLKNEQNIDSSVFPEGVYTVQVYTPTGVVNKKLVKYR